MVSSTRSFHMHTMLDTIALQGARDTYGVWLAALPARLWRCRQTCTACQPMHCAQGTG